jgi:hypothetical protein
VYGSTLPSPTTPAGRRLEAEARAVERVVRGDDPEPRVAPVRTLRASADGPRVDSGGFLREVTRQLKARGSDESGSTSALTSDIWRAPTDATEDPNFQRAAAEDRQAFERWRVDHNTSSDQAAVQAMDRAELDRHAQFMEQYGSTLYGNMGAGGVGGSSDFAADDPNAPDVAAHEAFAGMFTEGWRGLDLGVGGFIGQFGRRDKDESDKINRRIANYAHEYPRRDGETDEQYGARLHQLQASTMQEAHILPAQSPTTTPTGKSAPATGATPAGGATTGATPVGQASGQRSTASVPGTATPPTSGASDEPPDVAAHEAFAGMFTEGWRGLDFGIGGLIGEFQRRDPNKQKETNQRISDYASNYGKRDKETPEELEARSKHLSQILEQSGAQKAATPAATPPAPGGASPAGAATAAQAGAAAAPPPATTTATVAGAAAVGAVAGAGIATAAHALHGERGSRGREREVPGADPTDVLAHLDDHDVEALASMLYGRIVTRFRKQLLIDRERSGFLTDFR